MRLDRNQLARLLSQLSKAVESRNTIPVLACVRLVKENGALTATATDLEVEITGSMPADGPDAAFCVDAKLLAGIVAKLGSGEVDIEYDGNRATIKSGRSRFKLDTLPVDDFPSMAAGAMPEPFTADLAALVAPVAFAMSDEESRYYLNGVFLQPGIATATNGHRLASNAGNAWGEHAPVILPRKLVGILPKGDVQIALTDTKVRVVADDVTIISKLIDGSYPDYERVIPRDAGGVLTVDNATLRGAAERVATVAGDRGRSVRLSIASDTIELFMRGDGEATDSVPCSYSGAPIEIGFNVAYLVEMLANLPAGDVNIALTDGGAPALFTSPAAEGLRDVLMPVRV
jgi:DNA polymerase-3 subunit beta